MKNNITEILKNYTAGEITLEQANADLKAAGSGLYLDPTRNELTEEEIDVTVAGETSSQADGYGLLDTGTGSLDKVQVESGKLVDNDCGDMPALVLIGGRVYHVKGDTLVD